MRICVILPCNIYTAPYYKRYEEMILDMEEKFDLIIWNRAIIDEFSKGKKIEFQCKDELNTGKFSKIIKYIRFAKFVKQKIKTSKYDKIIILSSYAGIMALLSGVLKRNYNRRYWLDIRDYTFENIPIYYKLMKVAIENSWATSISSPAYQEFLPKHNYIIGHNIDFENIELSINKRKAYVSCSPIRISFIGLIRYYDEQKKLIDTLANDERFILQFYGMNCEYLREYCNEKNILNVDFYGRFLPSETANFYEKTDIINNVYGNNSVAFTTALSNKLYFSAALRIPIIVSPNTYMERLTVERGFGFPFDYNDPMIADKLYKWYCEFHEKRTNVMFDEYFQLVVEEDKIFMDKFKNFIIT